MSIPKSLTFIDRFTIEFTNPPWGVTNYTAKITSYSSTEVSYTMYVKTRLLSILFYVAYKLDIPVDITYKRELFSTISNSFYTNQFDLNDINKFVTLLKSINEKYNADPAVKSMMTSWTQMGPFSATLTQKLTKGVMDLKAKYVNKQGYIKPVPGMAYDAQTMSAPYLLYNSFLNMYEITYSSYTQPIRPATRTNTTNSNTVKLYRFELFDKSGKKVTDGLEVLVDVLGKLASSTSNNASPLRELKQTSTALIENIKHIFPDPITTFRDYKDSTFLKIKTGLDLLDKLYKTNQEAREFINNYSMFTPIQFIQL